MRCPELTRLSIFLYSAHQISPPLIGSFLDLTHDAGQFGAGEIGWSVDDVQPPF